MQVPKNAHATIEGNIRHIRQLINSTQSTDIQQAHNARHASIVQIYILTINRQQHKQHTIAILRYIRCKLHKIVIKQINVGRMQQATTRHDIGGGTQHKEIRVAMHTRQTKSM